MGRTRGSDRTEDDAERGRMLWEEANSCMFSLPHCLYISALCMLAFVGVVLLEHAFIQ